MRPSAELCALMQYGHQWVPISAEVENELRYQPEKGMHLLGFVAVEEIPRHYYMKVCSDLFGE